MTTNRGQRMFFRVLRPPRHDGDPDYHLMLRKWHSELQENRAGRARLRRCHSPEEVLLTSEFAVFYRRFSGLTHPKDHRILGLATVAGVLSHVERDDPLACFARQLGWPKPGEEKPIVSELRFRKLRKSEDWPEFFRNLLRAVSLLGKRANLVSLADDILHWGDEHQKIVARAPIARLQVRWALDYYGAPDEALVVRHDAGVPTATEPENPYDKEHSPA